MTIKAILESLGFKSVPKLRKTLEETQEFYVKAERNIQDLKSIATANGENQWFVCYPEPREKPPSHRRRKHD